MSVKNIVSQFVMVALCLLSLAIGTDGFNLTGLNSLIFWQSRFPRTLSIVLVGSSMSLSLSAVILIPKDVLVTSTMKLSKKLLTS